MNLTDREFDALEEFEVGAGPNVTMICGKEHCKWYWVPNAESGSLREFAIAALSHLDKAHPSEK